MAEDTSTDTGTDAEDTSTTTGGKPENAQPDEVPPAVKAALRKANKEAETLRLRLKEFEDRDKSEAEKVAERLAAAEDRASKAETDLIRMEVAAAKGLTPAQAKRLVGATREELETDADELVATFTPASNANSESAKNVRPTPNLRRQQVPVSDGGGQQDANAQMNDWLRSAARK